MRDYQLRVVWERDELSEKINKLRTFINGRFFSSIDPEEQYRLAHQYLTMAAYLDVLESRIAAFKES